MSRWSLRRHLSLEPLEDRRLLAAMPQPLADVDLGFAVIDSDNIVQIGSTLFFAAHDDDNGTELWRSDGTAAGTTLVRDINTGSNSSEPSDLTAVDGVLFFTAREDTHGRELWRSDGTAAGTVLVSDIYTGTNSSNPDELIDVDGTLYFSAYESTGGRELRRSDGTANGTVIVSNINPGSNNADPQELFNLRGTVFFSAVDGVHGRELWKTDGTNAGTAMVADIFTGSLGSNPQELSDFGGRLFFTADDGSGDREPWILSSTAVDDSYVMLQGQELVTTAANGVLVNDVDVTPLSAALVQGPSNGTVSLNADGSFTYRPLTDFIGTDTFTYRAREGVADTNVATVTISIAEPLGPIVLTDVDDVNPAAADLWYSVETTRAGLLTIEATSAGSPASVELALFGDTNFTGTPLATSTIVTDATNPLVTAPDVTATTATGQATGSLTPFETYRYRITFSDGPIDSATANESPASAVVGPITLSASQGSVQLSGVSVDAGGLATRRRIYRSSDGGTTYRFVGEITGNVTTTFTDSLSDAAAAANPELDETVVGRQRIDWTVLAAGEMFYVRVTGTASQVDLRFANLVEQNGSLVTVYGTQNDDTFDFTPGGTSHIVTIDDLQYQFDASVVDSVVFEADEWVTENVELRGTLLATGALADTAEIIQTDALGDAQWTAPAASTTAVLAATPNVVGTTATANTTGGGLTGGATYQYRVVFSDGTVPPLPDVSNAEGVPSAAIGPVTLGASEDTVDLAAVPTDASGNYTSRRIYRSGDGGTTYRLVGTIPDNATTTFADTLSDATAAGNALLSGNAITGTYSYYVTFADTAGGPGFGRESRPAPLIGPLSAAAGRIQLRDLPQDGSGQWTHRRIYRNLAADANAFHFVGEIEDATTAGMTFTDNASDAIIAANPQINLEGEPITDSTLLVDVLRRVGATYNQVFQEGTLQFDGSKGGTALATKSLVITATSTVLELYNFMEQAMGIREVPGPDPLNPIPDGDPSAATVNPSGSVTVDGRIRLVGNNGVDNALAIAAGDLRLVTAGGTNPVVLPFASAQSAVGESAAVDFSVMDFRGTSLDVRLTIVLEARDASTTTWRWFADSSDNDPATGVGIAVGTGLAVFDAAGDFVSTTEATVSIDRNAALPSVPFEFELDFSQITAPNAGASALTASTGGGSDTANLNDSSRDDDFVGAPGFGSLSSSQYSVVVRGPENINVFATAGGVDEAKLFDSPGDDEFVGKTDFAQLSGTGFDNRVYSFEGVHAYASSGGTDEAKLFDSPGDDTFYAEPVAAALFGTGFFNRVKFFDGVHAFATAGGNDTARLFDSDQDDRFVATPESSALFGTGYFNRAKFFEQVFAEAGNGGNDLAELNDSTLNDLLLAENDSARMTNEDLGNIFQQATDFGTVRVFGTTGTNRRDVRLPLSFVIQFFGTWVDV